MQHIAVIDDEAAITELLAGYLHGHGFRVRRLKPQDLRLRFFSVRGELPRSELARLTQINYAREKAFGDPHLIWRTVHS